jgi:molybdenum cofactor guanylyltransferase
MLEAAAIILAGGRSSRMGSPKAALDWHGSTLLRRVTGIAQRTVEGPVLVVRAPGQQLPKLHPSVEIVDDAREGRGPLQGLAAGLAAAGQRAEVVYVSSTDVPLLHPAFISRVLSGFAQEVDVVLPEVRGFRQPLSAGYRISLLPSVEALIAADKLKPAFLFAQCRVLRLNDEAMLQDRAVAEGDPGLMSVRNLNHRSDYEQALAWAAPEIAVRRSGALAPAGTPELMTVRGWTLGDVAAAVDLPLDERVLAALNGEQITRDPELPLAACDKVTFTATDARG